MAFLIALAELPGPVGAQGAPRIIHPVGFVTIDWLFAETRRDLYDSGEPYAPSDGGSKAMNAASISFASSARSMNSIPMS